MNEPEEPREYLARVAAEVGAYLLADLDRRIADDPDGVYIDATPFTPTSTPPDPRKSVSDRYSPSTGDE